MSKRSNKPRNLLHNHPLLRKGGVHQKTRKAQRRGDKQALRKTWSFPSIRSRALSLEKILLVLATHAE